MQYNSELYIKVKNLEDMGILKSIFSEREYFQSCKNRVEECIQNGKNEIAIINLECPTNSLHWVINSITFKIKDSLVLGYSTCLNVDENCTVYYKLPLRENFEQKYFKEYKYSCINDAMNENLCLEWLYNMNVKIPKKDIKVIHELFNIHNLNNIIEDKTQIINQRDNNKIRDIDRKTPYVPKNAIILNNKLDDGFTIKELNGNEWVWVEVPKNITANARNENEIEILLKEYTYSFFKKIDPYFYNTYFYWYADEYNKNIKIEEKHYYELKKSMLNSLKENGGFYIGRYDVGYFAEDNSLKLSYQDVKDRLVIQKNAFPIDQISIEDAQIASEKLAPEGLKGSLMFRFTVGFSYVLFNICWKNINKRFD